MVVYLRNQLDLYEKRVIEDRDDAIRQILAQQYAIAESRLSRARKEAEALFELSVTNPVHTSDGGNDGGTTERKTGDVIDDSDNSDSDSSSSSSSSSQASVSDADDTHEVSVDGVEERKTSDRSERHVSFKEISQLPRVRVNTAPLAPVLEDVNWLAVGSLIDDSPMLWQSNQPVDVSYGRQDALLPVSATTTQSSSHATIPSDRLFGTSLPIPIPNRMRDTHDHDDMISIPSTTADVDTNGSPVIITPSTRRNRVTASSWLNNQVDVAASLLVSEMDRMAANITTTTNTHSK